MKILPIYIFGNNVLRKKAAEISDSEFEKIPALVEDMFATMYKAEGVGLAAPQIGQSIRLFIIDTEPFIESYPETELLKEVFINPVMEEEFGDDFRFNEGCLSLPELREDVTRKSEIKITYTNLEGVRETKHFKGLVARVIQHEYDHLEGKVFTDSISPIRKMVIKKKLDNISKGKVGTAYRVARH